ncbi:hypothetical protein R3Q06_33675 [Rhodococcus erythropolis]|uniref:hypothetical protein n=1 Tax=Rhodococcus erythropolis TaxID=1833 RepID=UPI00294A2E7A|nr:hypothetical protein [Rhodococcus erythropolis]MDV6278382.1 hypothetical protein [Rhodococcus erythropolis]
MNTERTTPRPRTRGRKLLYTSFAVGVLTGAVCAGTGISAATPEVATALVHIDTSQEDSYEWTLLNHTGQTVYGKWTLYGGSDKYSSSLESTKDHPWQVDEASSALQKKKPRNYWRANICYSGQWWVLPTVTPVFDLTNHIVSLEVDSKGTLHEVEHENSQVVRRPLTALSRC